MKTDLDAYARLHVGNAESGVAIMADLAWNSMSTP
jgi:hypothetical protein